MPRPFRPAPAPRPIPAPPLASVPHRPSPAPAPPRVRLQDEEPPLAPPRPTPRTAPPPVAVTIPTPEELGVGSRTAERDWTAGYRRLCDLGASCFQMSKLPQGGCRVTCLMPTEQVDRNHRIEAEAGSEAEAVRLVVRAAEEWAAQKR